MYVQLLVRGLTQSAHLRVHMRQTCCLGAVVGIVPMEAVRVIS